MNNEGSAKSFAVGNKEKRERIDSKANPQGIGRDFLLGVFSDWPAASHMCVYTVWSGCRTAVPTKDETGGLLQFGPDKMWPFFH